MIQLLAILLLASAQEGEPRITAVARDQVRMLDMEEGKPTALSRDEIEPLLPIAIEKQTEMGRFRVRIGEKAYEIVSSDVIAADLSAFCMIRQKPARRDGRPTAETMMGSGLSSGDSACERPEGD